MQLSTELVEVLDGGLGTNRQRAVCILLSNPNLEDPMAHRCLPLTAELSRLSWISRSKSAEATYLREIIFVESCESFKQSHLRSVS